MLKSSTEKPIVIGIVGPTAVGKTKLSVELALEFNAEIVSYDSRQFYKELTIGTAVPSIEERANVPHHFIQNKTIHKSFTLADYEKEALDCISEIHSRSKKVILVGGSGMYEKVVLHGLDEMPKSDPKIREELTQRFDENGLAPLVRELQIKDPAFCETADLANPRRVLRALEVFYSAGVPFSRYKNHTPKKRPFQTLRLGLERPREELYSRINDRVLKMMADGLLEEAKSVYPFRENNALQTVGYRELFRSLDGDWDLNRAILEIQKNTRRFAKRQLTWYRKEKDLPWFSPEDLSKVYDFISTKI